MKKRTLDDVQKQWNTLQDQFQKSNAQLEQLKSQVGQAQQQDDLYRVPPMAPQSPRPTSLRPPKRKKAVAPQPCDGPSPLLPVKTYGAASTGRQQMWSSSPSGHHHLEADPDKRPLQKKADLPLSVGPPLDARPQDKASDVIPCSSSQHHVPPPPPMRQVERVKKPRTVSHPIPSTRPGRDPPPCQLQPPSERQPQVPPLSRPAPVKKPPPMQVPSLHSSPPPSAPSTGGPNLSQSGPPTSRIQPSGLHFKAQKPISGGAVPPTTRALATKTGLKTSIGPRHHPASGPPAQRQQAAAAAATTTTTTTTTRSSSQPKAGVRVGQKRAQPRGSSSTNKAQEKGLSKGKSATSDQTLEHAVAGGPSDGDRNGGGSSKAEPEVGAVTTDAVDGKKTTSTVADKGSKKRASGDTGRMVTSPTPKLLFPGLVWLPEAMPMVSDNGHKATLQERVNAFVRNPLKERWWESAGMTRYSPLLVGPDMAIMSYHGVGAFKRTDNSRSLSSWCAPSIRPAIPPLFSMEASPLRSIRSLQPPRPWPMDLNKPLCPYDLHGTCNDDSCPYQHVSIYNSQDREKPQQQDIPTTATTQADGQSAETGAESTGKDSFEPWYAILNRSTPPPGYKSSISHGALWEQLSNWVGDGKESHPRVLAKAIKLVVASENAVVDGGIMDPEHFLVKSGFLEPPIASGEETRYYWQRDGETLSSSLKASRVPGIKLADLKQHVEEQPNDVDAWLLLAFNTLIDSANFRFDSEGDEVVIISRQEVVSWLQSFRKEVQTPTAVKPALKILSRALDANPSSAPLWLLYTHVLISAPNLGPEDTLAMLEQAARRQVSCLEIWSACETFARGILAHLPTLVGFYDRSLACVSSSGKDYGRVMVPMLLSRTALLLQGGYVADGYLGLSSVLPVSPIDMSSFANGGDGGTFLLKDIKPPKSKKYQCILWLAYTHLIAFGDLPEAITLLSWMDWPDLSSRLGRLCWGRNHRKLLSGILRREPERRSTLMVAFTACFASTKASPSWECLEGAHKSPEEEVAWILAWNCLLVEDILNGGNQICPTLRSLMIGVQGEEGQQPATMVSPQVLVGLEEPLVLMTALDVVWGDGLGSNPDAWGMVERMLRQVQGKGQWEGKGEEGMCWVSAMVLLARASRQLRECEGFAVWRVVQGLVEETWSVLDGLIAGSKGGKRPVPDLDYLACGMEADPGPHSVEAVMQDLMTLRHTALLRLGKGLPEGIGSSRRVACITLYRILVAVRVDLACRGPKEAMATLAQILEDHKASNWLPADFRAILWTELVHLCLNHHLQSSNSEIIEETSGASRMAKECNDLLGSLGEFARYVSHGVSDLFPGQEPLVVMEQTPSSLTLAVVSRARREAFDQLIMKDFIEASLGQFWITCSPPMQSLAVKSLLDLTPPSTLGGPLVAVHVLRPIYGLLARFEAARSLGRGLVEVGSWRSRLQERIRIAVRQLMRRHPLVGDDGWLHVYHATLLLSVAHAVGGDVSESEGLVEMAVGMQPLAFPAWLQLLRMDDAFGNRPNRKKQVEECIKLLGVLVPTQATKVTSGEGVGGQTSTII